VRKRKRETERQREREYLYLKGMTGALEPFSYLVYNKRIERSTLVESEIFLL
jgi:hypothetical protein